MKIDLTPGQERIVKDHHESGQFHSVEEVIAK